MLKAGTLQMSGCINHYMLSLLQQTWEYVGGLVQDCSISSVLTLEILQFCTKYMFYLNDYNALCYICYNVLC